MSRSRRHSGRLRPVNLRQDQVQGSTPMDDLFRQSIHRGKYRSLDLEVERSNTNGVRTIGRNAGSPESGKMRPPSMKTIEQVGSQTTRRFDAGITGHPIDHMLNAAKEKSQERCQLLRFPGKVRRNHTDRWKPASDSIPQLLSVERTAQSSPGRREMCDPNLSATVFRIAFAPNPIRWLGNVDQTV